MGGEHAKAGGDADGATVTIMDDDSHDSGLVLWGFFRVLYISFSISLLNFSRSGLARGREEMTSRGLIFIGCCWFGYGVGRIVGCWMHG